MTKHERELHERMNAAINEAFASLLADFDITHADLKAADVNTQAIRGDLKEALFLAYRVSHSID